MKKSILLYMYVCMVVCIHAQDREPQDVALGINKWGNVIAFRDCNVYELADFLNTSPMIALRLLEKQLKDSSDAFIMKEGDSIDIDYGWNLIPGKVSGIGKIIYDHLDTRLDKYLFSNYWNGGLDVELTENQFAGILLSIKLEGKPNIFIPNNSLTSKCCSFYNTRYEKSFGYATIYFDSDNRIIGFSDIYDFDSKNWGVRPVKYEIYIRIVRLISPSSSSGFNVCFKNGMP